MKMGMLWTARMRRNGNPWYVELGIDMAHNVSARDTAPTNPEHVVLALALIARPVLDFTARPDIAFLLYPFNAALTLQLKTNGILNLIIT